MLNKGEILNLSGSTYMVYNPKDKLIKFTEVAKFGFNLASNINIKA